MDVVVLAAGGTIGMAGDGPVLPALDAESLPGLPEGVEARTLSLKPSVQLSGAEALAIARAAAGQERPVVVTHGTDTLEESAYLCDLLYGGEAPVVFTGAMRPASAPGADGAANLRDAIAVAESPAARGLGVLVVFAGAIYAARSVRKLDSTAPAAFGPDPLGWVAEGRAQIARRVERRAPLDVRRFDAFVPIATAGLATDARHVPTEADGLVAVVLGAGHTPPPFLDALGEVAQRIPVVVTVRPLRGSILHATYGFDGSEESLRSLSAVLAGGLSPAAARVKLMAVLGTPGADVAAAFAADDV